jgi:hypothetical protein
MNGFGLEGGGARNKNHPIKAIIRGEDKACIWGWVQELANPPGF